ncbi:hypothetical protein IR148_13310 [Dysgonomonas mossii]|nr:hypothetical protein [Dysgonomonas mossii]
MQYTKKKCGACTAPSRGTGIPEERNRHVHTILSYSMNIAHFVSFF